MDTEIFTKKWPYRVLLLFLFFSIYSFALSPGITTGDAGELTSAAMVMGIPHPPGYPLWTLLARIFTLLFPENPGFGTNLFSMLAGIASVLLAFETVSLDAPYWLSFLAATNIGLFPQVLNYSTVTEVYSLTIFFFLLLLFLYKKGLFLPSKLCPWAVPGCSPGFTHSFSGIYPCSNQAEKILFYPIPFRSIHSPPPTDFRIPSTRCKLDGKSNTD